jgi:hypothetical protein
LFRPAVSDSPVSDIGPILHNRQSFELEICFLDLRGSVRLARGDIVMKMQPILDSVTARTIG